MSTLISFEAADASPNALIGEKLSCKCTPICGNIRMVVTNVQSEENNNLSTHLSENQSFELTRARGYAA